MKSVIRIYVIASLVCALFFSFSEANAQRLTLGTPYQIASSNEASTSSIITYRKAKYALMQNVDSSANYQSLNGEWRVKFLNSTSQLSSQDLNSELPIAKWGASSVELPGVWQVASSHGSALYSEKAYPFLESKPKAGDYSIPQSGDVALYARDFSVPFDYMDKAVFLTIGAASSKVTLYVNGEKVGFATDSKNPSQYNITKFINRGRNRVVVMVEQFSGASWVEDASGWRLSGVNRGIYILAQPKIRVRDVLTSTTFDVDYRTGLLQSALLLKSELLNPHTVKVYYDLYDTSGKVIRRENKKVTLDMRREDTVRFHSSIQEVEKWSSETPNLYTVVYSVERENRITEVAAIKVGFRSVETRDGKLLINGKAPKIIGVNFEETNPHTGSVLNREEVKSELLKMRKVGFNAIRTGGYPLPQYFYDLTDSIGFYVFNIANINTNGLENSLTKGGSLANNPAWSEVFVQRALTAYERTKRNASVIAVGLGENAGNGYAMYEAYNAIRARNQSQVIVYDGANAEWNTDIATPLYPTFKELKQSSEWGVLQPIIPSRVKFDKRYWELDYTQGAFVDRWRGATLSSQGVKNYSELNDNYNLRNRVNGNVKESSAQSDLAKIAELFTPIRIEYTSGKDGVVTLYNNMQQTNFDQLKFRYRRVVNAKAKEWQEVELPSCKVGESVELVLERYDGAKTELELDIQFYGTYKSSVR